MKILIVGSGYAGSLLNYFLCKKGISTVVADRAEEHTSTKVSAGIMLPLTGRRIVKTYNADTIIPFALQTYRELESNSGLGFLITKNVLQLFTSPGNKNEWFAASEDSGIKNYTGTILPKQDIHPSVAGELGGILLQHSGAVDPVTLIKSVERVTSGMSSYHNTSLAYDEIELRNEGVRWRDNFYDRVIFCEGYHTTSNPWFGYIPFKPAKGEIINFSAPELDDRYIINGSVFILPEGNGNFRAGSTYNWADLTPIPTPEARMTLEEGIRKIINCNFNITGHRAGIRPAIIDRRPVIGFHPSYNMLGIFNGLGTKGAMLAPYFASRFSELIADGKSVDADVSITRFEKYFAA